MEACFALQHYGRFGRFQVDKRPNRSILCSMRVATMLTTTEAAEVAAVTPSTIKRWADQGILPSSRTVGGHRRFERVAIERLLREEVTPISSGDPLATAWVRCLVDGRRHEIDGRLLDARGRLGSWWRVAEELAVALAEMGRQWDCGRLTIAQEHVASDGLARGLARVGDALPNRLDGPSCLLACAGEDEHTIGLSLAELCLRELGWTPLWLGRRTPTDEVVRLVRGGRVAMVALSASALLADGLALRAVAEEVGAACADRGAGLLLCGAGAWPSQPSCGVRITSFTGFREYLAGEGVQP
jgi:excisionase family DNA binding protein